MATPPVRPVWRPCLACASRESTNRPLSFHLKKSLRKHLSGGVCFRTATGVRATLPALATIENTSCICLACANIIDTLVTALEKRPGYSLLPHGATVAQSSSNANGAYAIPGARRVIARTRAPFARPVARIAQQPQTRGAEPAHGPPTVAAAAPTAPTAPHASADPAAASAVTPGTPNVPPAQATATAAASLAHAQANGVSRANGVGPVSSASASTDAVAAKAESVPPVRKSPSAAWTVVAAAATTTVVPEAPPAAAATSAPAGVCVVCHASSGGACGSDCSAPLLRAMKAVRARILELVGSHVLTVESVVRIFRAARVELAEGVCAFDSRAFAAQLLAGEDGVVCDAHFAALEHAAEVKAAGAVPCAVCGDKPTLAGGEEVRSLAPVLAKMGSDGVEKLVVFALAVDLRKRRGDAQADTRAEKKFEQGFMKFLEKEFACTTCFQALWSKC